MSALVPHRMPTAVESVELSRTAYRVATTDMIPKDQRGNVNAVLAMFYAGWELGLSPMQSVRSFHIIEGKPSESAELLLTLALRHGIDVFVAETTREHCTVEVRRPEWPEGRVGTVTWTMEDASDAGLTGKGNWKKYPRSMLRARAVTEAIRAYCPDVTVGASFTPEELGGDVEGPFATPAGRQDSEWLADADPEVVRETIEVIGHDVDELEVRQQASAEDRDPTIDDFLHLFDDAFLATQKVDELRAYAAESPEKLSHALSVLEARAAAWDPDASAEEDDDDPDVEDAEVVEEDGVSGDLTEGADPDEGGDEVAADSDQYPVHKGGGHYLLSDGTPVRGKAAATAQQAALDVDTPAEVTGEAGPEVEEAEEVDTSVPPEPEPAGDGPDPDELLHVYPDDFLATQKLDELREFIARSEETAAQAMAVLDRRFNEWKADQEEPGDLAAALEEVVEPVEASPLDEHLHLFDEEWKTTVNVEAFRRWATRGDTHLANALRHMQNQQERWIEERMGFADAAQDAEEG